MLAPSLYQKTLDLGNRNCLLTDKPKTEHWKTVLFLKHLRTISSIAEKMLNSIAQQTSKKVYKGNKFIKET